ncbi:MAG: hypothetical protein DMG67_05505 [Acidobacteria bacterium]|nr:MAG: hypothetical protein DMG67_05505 [Acidobacteriota bacterium]
MLSSFLVEHRLHKLLTNSPDKLLTSAAEAVSFRKQVLRSVGKMPTEQPAGRRRGKVGDGCATQPGDVAELRLYHD